MKLSIMLASVLALSACTLEQVRRAAPSTFTIYGERHEGEHDLNRLGGDTEGATLGAAMGWHLRPIETRSVDDRAPGFFERRPPHECEVTPEDLDRVEKMAAQLRADLAGMSVRAKALTQGNEALEAQVIDLQGKLDDKADPLALIGGSAGGIIVLLGLLQKFGMMPAPGHVRRREGEAA